VGREIDAHRRHLCRCVDKARLLVGQIVAVDKARDHGTLDLAVYVHRRHMLDGMAVVVDHELGRVRFGVGDLRRHKHEPPLKFCAVQKIGFDLAAAAKGAADQSDVLELGDKNACARINAFADRLGDTRGRFFGMDGKEQAPPQLGNEPRSFEPSSARACCSGTARVFFRRRRG
jgi:hypothetical protein